jgi:hypothetical protein
MDGQTGMRPQEAHSHMWSTNTHTHLWVHELCLDPRLVLQVLDRLRDRLRHELLGERPPKVLQGSVQMGLGLCAPHQIF